MEAACALHTMLSTLRLRHAGFVALLCTTPLRAILDQNADGLSDIWAAFYPTAGAPSADPDGDGAANLAESLAGTDPLDAASRFAATTERSDTGEVRLRWRGVIGKQYRLETSPDLRTWSPLPPEYTGQNEDLAPTVRAANSPATNREFWRVVVSDRDSDANGLTGWEEAQRATDTRWSIAAAVPNGVFDNARPMADSVYDPASNTTFATYLGGTAVADAGIYVFSYNHSTKTQDGPFPLFLFSANSTTNDGHSYPQIVRTQDGYIHVFFVNQRSLGGVDPHCNFHFRFDSPGTIAGPFTTQRLRLGGAGLYGRAGTALIQGEYPKAFVARNGTLYYFTRAVPTSANEPTYTYNGTSYRVAFRSQIYVKSTDNGLTWEAAKVGITRRNLTDFLTEPYLTQVIAEPPRAGVPERFHFVWTLAAGIDLYFNASGTLVYNYHNGFSKNLYHAYFVPGVDRFYAMDGTDLGETIDGDEIDAHCVVKTTGSATIPPLPMTYAEHQALATAPSVTSIMGNIATIDGAGVVTINGTYRWTGTEWAAFGTWPSDTRFSEWRHGAYYAYRQNGSVYKSLDGLGTWVPLGSIFDDPVGVAKLPEALRTLSGSVRITATTVPAHPEARFWYKRYGSDTFQGYVILGGHTSSCAPYAVLAQVDRGTVAPGESFTLQLYLTDEWGARVTGYTRTLNVATSLPASFAPSAVTAEGRATIQFTVAPGAAPGEYRITATGTSLDAGSVWVTVK